MIISLRSEQRQQAMESPLLRFVKGHLIYIFIDVVGLAKVDTLHSKTLKVKRGEGDKKTYKAQ